MDSVLQLMGMLLLQVTPRDRTWEHAGWDGDCLAPEALSRRSETLSEGSE